MRLIRRLRILKEAAMKLFVTGAALLALLAAATPKIDVAAAEDCRQKCQAIENQCRMTSKDLDSSRCAAKFLACLSTCKSAR